jgi:ribonuclease-3
MPEKSLPDFHELEKKLQTKFKKLDLLRQAMVHRSYLNENPDFELEHNERLEFLGDAVLELAVTEHLYGKYKNPEGDLTNWRSSLVNSHKLADISRRLDFEKYLYLSRGEAKDTGRAREYILGNAFEAVVGSMFLDQGLAAAKKFIDRELLVELPTIIEKKLYLDPKSNLQERAQEELHITPQYRVLESFGPDHDKRFRVGVFLADEKSGEGEGSSKQTAQLAAAVDALHKKGWE